MPGGSGGKSGIVAAFLVKYYGNGNNVIPLTKPIDTIVGKDRFGLVSVVIEGETYIITDIGMRMLSPRELFDAQGFPHDYIINPIYKGKPLTKTAQVRMCGNSVCPPMAEALIRANYIYIEEREAA
jgi:DNA (cytosine-5)-methyltransferase 1